MKGLDEHAPRAPPARHHPLTVKEQQGVDEGGDKEIPMYAAVHVEHEFHDFNMQLFHAHM